MQLIHRYWSGKGDTNPWIRQAVQSLNQQYTLEWTDAKLSKRVLSWLDEHKDDVLPENRIRHRANMVRLYLLDRYGGWWLDHDVIPLKPFSELPFPAIASHGDIRVCTCVMGFPPGHPFIRLVLDNLTTNPKSIYASGEALVDSFMGTEEAKDITRLPLPFDSKGNWMNREPWAIHLHNTSKGRV